MLIACENSGSTNNNPNVNYLSFSVTLNLNLPSFAALNSNINPMLVTGNNYGVNGIIVMKISDTEYKAWEANCPNHKVSSCSQLKITSSNAKCGCDDKVYSLFTGQSTTGGYNMIPYRVEILSNNNIRISN